MHSELEPFANPSSTYPVPLPAPKQGIFFDGLDITDAVTDASGFDVARATWPPSTALNDLARRIHVNAVQHGFWPEGGRNFGEMIALMHSELSEALEAHRSGEPKVWFKHAGDCTRDSAVCNCVPKPEGAATELIDAVIRALDTLYDMHIDIDSVAEAKMRYNETRPHKHGKAY